MQNIMRIKWLRFQAKRIRTQIQNIQRKYDCGEHILSIIEPEYKELKEELELVISKIKCYDPTFVEN